MSKPTDDYQAEATRLRRLPRQDQRQAIAWQRAIAANPKVRQADRRLARAKADALERLLFPKLKRKA